MLLPLHMQLQQLDGVQVTLEEKVEAGNMVGAAADGLVSIRRRFFPKGELEDGGGAVPPTAAGEYLLGTHPLGWGHTTVDMQQRRATMHMHMHACAGAYWACLVDSRTYRHIKCATCCAGWPRM